MRHRGVLDEFAQSLEELRDKQLDPIATHLRDEPFDRNALPLVQKTKNRLDEMLAELPGSGPGLNAAGRIPDSSRREIEDYFRDLSDDFGNEQWNTEKPAP
jgi:hypothetical protein